MKKINLLSTLIGVVQFWLERPVSPDGKIANLDLSIKFSDIKKITHQHAGT